MKNAIKTVSAYRVGVKDSKQNGETIHSLTYIIENDHYALVYSKDDSKPSFIRNAEQETYYRYYVKKIMKHWYGITGLG